MSKICNTVASTPRSLRVVLSSAYVQNVNTDENGNTVLHIEAEDLRIPSEVEIFLNDVCGDFSDAVRAKIYEMSTLHVLAMAIVK